MWKSRQSETMVPVPYDTNRPCKLARTEDPTVWWCVSHTAWIRTSGWLHVRRIEGRATGPKGTAGWYRWVRDRFDPSINEDLPWRNVCGACERVATAEALDANGGRAMSLRQRLWKCDRCGKRRPWRRFYEYYPPLTSPSEDDNREE